MRNLDGLADGLHRGSVVPPAESGAALFVVGDLPLMLQCRLWIQLVVPGIARRPSVAVNG
jgi:hypothetical protein